MREVDGVKVVPPLEPAALGVTAPEDAAWLKRRLTPHPPQRLHDSVAACSSAR